MSRVFDPVTTTRWDHDRVAPELVRRAAALPAATLHEAAGRIGALPPGLKPVAPAFRIAGSVVTVVCPNGDNLWIHRALCAAQPGDVLVVQTGDGADYGYWGEVMSTAARARHLGGLVIDGCVRDAPLLREIGFPVFARGLAIRGTVKDLGAMGWVNAPLLLGDVAIAPGDLIVGDEDGLVALPAQGLDAVLAAATAREAKEAAMCEALMAGALTLDLMGLR
ncbi:4-hydroxy-4-methyl-2-oxoglutarate aldolase [Novosphingobium sp. 1529]|uniref:4-carboxy-4-hydroxy-2-oxoadipate aldolase/oxaloacetate decarboxylase n=1 Tax=Novosphingobium sp. 1529 TaxID=3156424 RepID=UPI00149405AA